MMAVLSRPALRWAIPAGVLVAAVGAAGAGQMLVANASDGLPSRSAQQLLMDVAQGATTLTGMSGTVVEKSDLGLPQLPKLAAPDGTDLSTMITGSHTAKIWYGGLSQVRLSLLDGNNESDFIRNNQDVWTWDSKSRTATHHKLAPGVGLAAPDGKGSGVGPGGLPQVAPGNLSGAISQALGSLGTSTNISTDGTAKVAGRPAYELVLQPKDAASRVHQVRIAIDGDKHVPTRLQVYARGSDSPAFEMAFTHVSFSKPDAAEFAFKPPAGTRVQEGAQGDRHAAPDGRPEGTGKPDGTGDGSQSQTVGQGWTSVQVVKGIDLAKLNNPGTDPGAKAASQFVAGLPKVSGTWGSGRLLQSKLFSALLTDDGRLLIGAVDPAKLYEAAAQAK